MGITNYSRLMPTLIIVIIYVLICAKTVSDEQIEKTYVMYIFLQTRHILSRILKKIGTVQKQLDVLKLLMANVNF